MAPPSFVIAPPSARMMRCLPIALASSASKHARFWVAFLVPLAALLSTRPTIGAELQDGAQAASAPAPTSTASQPARASKKPPLTLEQLIARARKHYPGVAAARHALTAMQRKLFQAKWAWIPQGEIRGFVAPTPEIRCLDGNGNPDADVCVQTNVRDISLSLSGIMGRVQLDFGMPLYTFDKLASAKRAARAGVAAENARIEAAEGDVELKVTKAYWGLKLAKEILYTIKDGRKHLDKAIARIDEQLDEGTGDVTVTDLLRLKTHAAEVDARTLEARKLERLARASLAALTGLEAEGLEIDEEVIEPLETDLLAHRVYRNNAQTARPEVAMLNAAIAASRARVSLEKARFFPDLLLMGRLGIGRATNIDDPKNSFYNDPFNFTTGAIGLGMRWKLDSVIQYGKYKEAQAEASRAAARRSEAMIGIDIEIEKAFVELEEARGRVKVVHKGERAARSWLAATSQNLAAGLAEPKELSDALVAFFRARLSYLQAVFDANVGWSELARKIGASSRQLETIRDKTTARERGGRSRSLRSSSPSR